MNGDDSAPPSVVLQLDYVQPRREFCYMVGHVSQQFG